MQFLLIAYLDRIWIKQYFVSKRTIILFLLKRQQGERVVKREVVYRQHEKSG